MILIVDDDDTIRRSLSMLLRHSGYSVASAASPAEAMDFVRSQRPEAVFLDMNFTCSTSGDEGLTLLRQIKLFHPGVPVLLMTAWGSIQLAVEGIKAGAFDFITKPWDNRRLLDSLRSALELTSGEKPCDAEAAAPFDRGAIVGSHPLLMQALRLVERVAPTNAPVLITGESGTGKELFAEAIHRNSRRRNGPFVKVNLGAMPASLFESEMFGHRKGAFTGAVADRIGRFEAADGGTIFLDEVGELDLACQVKLLRVLQEQTFEPLGSSKTKRVDFRVVCATNADLASMVAARRFREDLFYRINVVSLELPPLRARGADVRLLAEKFLAEACSTNGLNPIGLAADAAAFLAGLPLGGNVRELRNLMERAALMATGEAVTAADLRAMAPAAAPAPSPLRLDDIEKRRVSEALSRCRGNVSAAAAELGISRAALYRRMEKYGIS